MNGPPMQKPSTMNFPDAEVIHQADMVVGVDVPRPVRFERPRRLAALGVAQVGRDNAELPLSSSNGLNGWVASPATVEFSPPPGITSSGKPEPASS
jgi:hypothetical protein